MSAGVPGDAPDCNKVCNEVGNNALWPMDT